MRILLHGINYTPELTGIGKYTGEMGAWLSRHGHTVDVITAMPYYPKWEKEDAYKGKWWHTEIIAGAKVKRCPFYVPKEVTGKSRMIHEFSFFLSSSVYWFGTLFKRYDIIVSVYPPLIIGFWPWLYTRFHRKTTWLFHIQDLQVDAARELGLIKNQRLLSILSKTESFWIRHATAVSSISPGMKQRILSKGIPEEQYVMLPNWAETDIICPMKKEESLRQEFDIGADKKVILYSGNLGEKQGVDMIVDAAFELGEQENIQFVIAGEGASKDRLMQYAENKGVRNVLFLPLQPYDRLAAFLAMADIHLVVQKKSAADLVLPSKFMSILSAGGAALVTANPGTSLYEMIQQHRVAYLCEPDHLESFVNALKSMLKEDHTQIRSNARAYSEKYLSIDAILTRFEKEMEEYKRL